MNDIARAINAWMQDYVDHPEKFEREWKTVSQFLTEKTGGKEPSYGEICAGVLERYRQIEPSRCATITFGGGHIGLPAGCTYVINLDPDSREYLFFTGATALADAAKDFREITQKFESMSPGKIEKRAPEDPAPDKSRSKVPCPNCLGSAACLYCEGKGEIDWPENRQTLTAVLDRLVKSGIDEEFLIGRLIHFALGNDTRESAAYADTAELWRKAVERIGTVLDVNDSLDVYGIISAIERLKKSGADA